ncbi:hypothetical protein UTI89_C5139 [Escherichia coli UTI89]|uniref:Uncharacterized protein n=1 Tax=Escherichia coli (strain UTI89 / UPEC) TaxID=364106 RepID=Q1R275_ECOUT|nr:hypothetical protein UTI89_C5139 [Escherichia coli UTI89]
MRKISNGWKSFNTRTIESSPANRSTSCIRRVCVFSFSLTLCLVLPATQYPVLLMYQRDSATPDTSSRLPATRFLPPLHIQLTFFHPRLTNSQTSRHATTGTEKSIRLATSHARGSKPPHHGIFIRLPCPNISIQRYSAWVCSRAMKNVQPAIAP